MGRAIGLEFFEGFEGAVELAGVAGFVAIDQGEGARFVGEFDEGERGADIGRNEGVGLVHIGALGVEFIIEGGGFDGPHALLAPAGGDHFFDEIEFDVVGRLEASDVGFAAGEVIGPVLGGEDDGCGSESVLERVLG